MTSLEEPSPPVVLLWRNEPIGNLTKEELMDALADCATYIITLQNRLDRSMENVKQPMESAS